MKGQGANQEAALRGCVDEVLFDLSANYGAMRAAGKCDALIDVMQGNFAVFTEIRQWAGEFQAMWQALPEGSDRLDDYYGEVDEYFDQQMKALYETHHLPWPDAPKDAVRG